MKYVSRLSYFFIFIFFLKILSFESHFLVYCDGNGSSSLAAGPLQALNTARTALSVYYFV